VGVICAVNFRLASLILAAVVIVLGALVLSSLAAGGG
jgi:hypothetical protein